MSLIPRAALDQIGQVLSFGAEKYDAHNWRKGYEWSKSYDALMRHMLAFWDGETFDPESGLPHLAHAGCHVLFMLTWLAEQGEGGEFDDRFVPPTPKSLGEVVGSTHEPEPLAFGDIAIVTGDSEGWHHRFEVGTEVCITQVDVVDGGRILRCEHLDGSDYWWVAEADLKPKAASVVDRPFRSYIVPLTEDEH